MIKEVLVHEGGYVFLSDEEDTGFFSIDKYSHPDEYQVEDCTLALENGQEIKVYRLIDAWSWHDVSPDRYEVLNQEIAERSYQSTESFFLK